MIGNDTLFGQIATFMENLHLSYHEVMEVIPYQNLLMMQKSYVYGIDKKGHKSINHESTALFIAACDNVCEKEVTLVLSSKEDVRKLRDYLNRYLEDNL